MKIFKYKACPDSTIFDLPEGFKPVKLIREEGYEFLTIWIAVDPLAPKKPHYITPIGTGHTVWDDAVYVDTIFDGPFVWHMHIRPLKTP